MSRYSPSRGSLRQSTLQSRIVVRPQHTLSHVARLSALSRGLPMQQMLFKQLSLKTPLHYFGSKNWAAPVLQRFIPSGVTELLSPFFGGGSLELAVTARGIRVLGYDKFQPLVHFWNTLQKTPNPIISQLQEFITDCDPATLLNVARDRYAHADSDTLKAALMLIIFNCSFNGMGFRGGGTKTLQVHNKIVYDVKSSGMNSRLVNYERVLDFHNPQISVHEADFCESLTVHPDTFAYLDPPYPVSTCCYGDSPEFHSEFPHEELAGQLSNRDNWVLSYNDVQLIRELYPLDKFDWYRVYWRQNSRRNGGAEHMRGNDVVITPRNQNKLDTIKHLKIN